MPIIQRPDLVSKIRKTYELLGPDAIATISPELVAVVIVDDISERDPGGTELYAYKDVTAGGANGPNIQLWNPPGSGVDILLETFDVCGNGGVYTGELRFYNSALSSGTTGLNRGLGRLGLPVGQIRWQDIAVSPGAAIGFYTPTNLYRGQYPPLRDWRLVPGEGIGFSAVGGSNLEGYFYWRETPLRV